MRVMKTVEQHYDDILSLANTSPVIDVPIEKALNRVLAEDIIAHYPIPPFTNSAMDGFAVRAQDVIPGQELRVVEDIPAGCAPQVKIFPGQASRIMTGAPLPEGANSVIRVEDTIGGMENMATQAPDCVVPKISLQKNANVRHAGEDVAVGEKIFTAGTRVTPSHIAAFSAVGFATVKVHRQLNVGVVATGNELRSPGEELDFGTIPDSNSFLVSGLLFERGANVTVRSLHSDDSAHFVETIEKLVSECDLVLTTGGVSAGAFDVVKSSLRSHGVNFTKVMMQPGKPQGFGEISGVPVICLPGNPVSVYVSMYLFVLPLLNVMEGGKRIEYADLFTTSVAGTSWKHKLGRDQFVPVVESERGVVPASAGGSASHFVGSLPKATALALVPATEKWVQPGQNISILRLR